MKAYTDLEQSKKLAEILPLESADMCWKRIYDENHMMSDYRIELIPYRFYSGFGFPAWSLAALLGILAEQHFIIKANTNWKDMIKVGNEFNIDIPIRHCKIWFPSLLDAAFEMVCWLKENGKI